LREGDFDEVAAADRVGQLLVGPLELVVDHMRRKRRPSVLDDQGDRKPEVNM
jgi:hypothetical protein